MCLAEVGFRPSVRGRHSLTGSKQGLLLGGNESRDLLLGSCRRRPQGEGWGPGSGIQNESGASVHLLPERSKISVTATSLCYSFGKILKFFNDIM